MKQFTYIFLISSSFCLFVNVNSLSISLCNITDKTPVAHIWNPTLFLAFPVNATELQLYIDPKLCVDQAFNNGTAYLLLSLSNTTVPTQPKFTDAEISTKLWYNGKAYKTSLHLHFNALLPAITGNIYTLVPYGYSYAPNMNARIDPIAHTYEYNINDKKIQLNTIINWNPNEIINVNNVQTNDLASLLLSPTFNFKVVESLYRYDTPLNNLSPLFFSSQNDYSYDQPLYPCTVLRFVSTYIQQTIGSMKTLENNPVLCAFTFQRSANITSTCQINIPLGNSVDCLNQK